MTDNKMLQAIANSIALLRQEMKDGFKKVDQKFEETNMKIEKVDNRVDKLGKTLAYLEDDTPTREEFDALEKRTAKN